ncbi:hypothetical protein [Flavobacterium sp.]|uniref:hypothetical protein n=1 Tax=Flavobacterium sp. TaxID=239 RepID=UPI002623BEED|nr:hypothetical protein [Flavobacterium sp.]
MKEKKFKKEAIEKIKGLDLKIDSSIQDICNTSNATSSNTRSVMYSIMIIIILAWIAIFNTHKDNWTEQRIKDSTEKIINLEKEMIKCKKHNKNSPKRDTLNTKVSLELEKKKCEKLIENKISNIQTMNIPLFGYSFDINNLGSILGIAFIFLLGILRFTIKREISNLIISMNAITDRYTNEGNTIDFKYYLDNVNESERIEAISSINYIRRKYHYNHLSMNEIFNLPPLKIAGVELENSKNEERFAKWIFWFPAVSYFLIVVNDGITLFEGFEVSETHTFITYGITLFSMFCIFILCRICHRQKKRLMTIFKEFKENNYMLRKEYVEELEELNE